MSLETQIEALLFVSDQPLSTARLAEVLPASSREEINKALKALEKRYADPQCAFHLARIAGGLQLLTKEEHGPLVRQLFRGKRRVRLTKAALETLAIIAYKQPTTRPEVDAIRGVSSGGVLETLMERDLVRIAGRADGIGRPLLYATTPAFLQYLGLNNLQDLPSLEELEAMIAEREEADRAAEDQELQELAALAEDEPESARPPAATLEERLAQERLPSLEEIDSELQQQGEQLIEVSNRLAEHALENDEQGDEEQQGVDEREDDGRDAEPDTRQAAVVPSSAADEADDAERPLEERGPA